MSETAAEVVVYGGTSAGVCAAVAAAATGAQVVLVEPGRHFGGMTSGGLGYTDLGDVRVIGGPAARFRAELAEHYGVPVGHYAGPEPHVAESIMERWLTEAGVEVITEAPITGATVTDGVITELITGPPETTRTFTAGCFVDASYEGDLLAAAGVSYRIGREDITLHGDSLAGRRELLPGRHAMPYGISPFRDDETGHAAGPVLPHLRDVPLVPVGHGDGGVMSYGFRACLTQAPDRIPFAPTDDYDEAEYELARRLFRHWARTGTEVRAGRLLGLEPNLPGAKCDANSLGPFSLSVLDGSAWDYPDALPERRAEIWAHHERHTRNFLWFLAEDPAVPAHVRAELQTWGLPADEFADTGHLPHQLYVREARRMVGRTVLTQSDLTDPAPAADVVALGSYHLDIREVQRTWCWLPEHPDPEAIVVTEGYLSVGVPPYPIGWSALLPRAEECRNLVVPVCLSASHVAFSSIRMEPQYMMLGHAAGIGAALAARSGDTADVAVDDLQNRLRDSGQLLAAPV